VTLFHHLRCFAKLAQYVSTRLAWERLDPPLRKRLENSFAWHDYGHSRGKIAPDLASPEDHDDLRDRGGLLRAAFAFPAAGAGRSFAPIMVGHCTDVPERSLRCVVTTCQR
jgi:hypothetical protein